MKSNNSNYEQKYKKYKYKYYKSKGGMNHNDGGNTECKPRDTSNKSIQDDLFNIENSNKDYCKPRISRLDGSNTDIPIESSIDDNDHNLDYASTSHEEKALDCLYTTYIHQYNNDIKYREYIDANELESKENTEISLDKIPPIIKKKTELKLKEDYLEYKPITNIIKLLGLYDDPLEENIKLILDKYKQYISNLYSFNIIHTDTDNFKNEDKNFCISFLIIYRDMDILINVLDDILLNIYYQNAKDINMYVTIYKGNPNNINLMYNIIDYYGKYSDYIILCNIISTDSYNSLILKQYIKTLNISYKIIQFNFNHGLYYKFNQEVQDLNDEKDTLADCNNFIKDLFSYRLKELTDKQDDKLLLKLHDPIKKIANFVLHNKQQYRENLSPNSVSPISSTQSLTSSKSSINSVQLLQGLIQYSDSFHNYIDKSRENIENLHTLCNELHKLLDIQTLTEETKLLFLFNLYEYFMVNYDINIWVYDPYRDYYNHYWENNDMWYIFTTIKSVYIMVKDIFTLVDTNTFRYNNLCKIPLLIYKNVGFDFNDNPDNRLIDFNINKCYVANPLNQIPSTSLYWSGQVTIYTKKENRYIQTRISGGRSLNIIVIYYCTTSNFMDTEILLIKEIKNVGQTENGYIYEIPSYRDNNITPNDEINTLMYTLFAPLLSSFDLSITINEFINKWFKPHKIKYSYKLSPTGCTHINRCNVYSCTVNEEVYTYIQNNAIIQDSLLKISYGKFVPLKTVIEGEIKVDASMMGIILQIVLQIYKRVHIEPEIHITSDNPNYEENLEICKKINMETKNILSKIREQYTEEILIEVQQYLTYVKQLKSQLQLPPVQSSILEPQPSPTNSKDSESFEIHPKQFHYQSLSSRQPSPPNSRDSESFEILPSQFQKNQSSSQPNSRNSLDSFSA